MAELDQRSRHRALAKVKRSKRDINRGSQGCTGAKSGRAKVLASLANSLDNPWFSDMETVARPVSRGLLRGVSRGRRFCYSAQPGKHMLFLSLIRFSPYETWAKFPDKIGL